MMTWISCTKKVRHCCTAILLITATLLWYDHSLLTLEWQTATAEGERPEDRMEGGNPQPLQNLSHNTSLSSPSKQSYCNISRVLPRGLEIRRKRAQNACAKLHNQLPRVWRRKLNRGPSTRILSPLRWDRLHHLLHCHVPKVASTTWAWHLLRALGVKDEVIATSENVHILLKERVPPPKAQDFKKGLLDGTLKFLVTRHPFQRLVSAYKNKIVWDTKHRHQYVALAQTIMKQHQNPNSSDLVLPTFRHFCHHVADSIETWLLQPETSSWPDRHWMPITYICSPCHLEYDVYCKMDTMDADTSFIANQCGLSHIINHNLVLNPSSLKEKANLTEMSTKDDAHHDQSTLESLKSRYKFEEISEDKKSKASNDIEAIALKKDVDNNQSPESEAQRKSKRQHLLQISYEDYLSELTHDDLQRLYKIYKFDFEIFGYN
ncbi:uncharacterized protein [Panulirus ornatus]|uniref:uncharacterized protein isoform X1 n=1 Tax=Panulirus ornatus TaxID=150431 RepID=UPI003A8C083B